MQMHRERRNCGTRFPHVVNVHDEQHTRKYCYVNVAHFASSSSLFLLMRGLAVVVLEQVGNTTAVYVYADSINTL